MKTSQDKKAAKAFVKALKALDKKLGLPKKEFASMLNIPERTYYYWCAGKGLPNEANRAKVRIDSIHLRSELANIAYWLLEFLAVTAEGDEHTED